MFNFGQMLFGGTAAYVVALFKTNFHIPRPLIIFIGFTAGLFSSFLIGLPSLRVRSLYFVSWWAESSSVFLYRIDDEFCGIINRGIRVKHRERI